MNTSNTTNASSRTRSGSALKAHTTTYVASSASRAGTRAARQQQQKRPLASSFFFRQYARRIGENNEWQSPTTTPAAGTRSSASTANKTRRHLLQYVRELLDSSSRGAHTHSRSVSRQYALRLRRKNYPARNHTSPAAGTRSSVKSSQKVLPCCRSCRTV